MVVLLKPRFSASLTSEDTIPWKNPVNNESETRKIINNLNVAETKFERVVAITAACKEFNHGNTIKHDKEANAGALTAIYRILHIVLTLKDGYDELHKICRALTFVCECSDNNLEKNLKTIGDELLELLVEVVIRSLRKLNQKKLKEDGALFCALKIMNRFNYIESLCVKISNKPDTQSILLAVIQSDVGYNIKGAAAEVVADLVVNAKSTLTTGGELIEVISIEVIMEATFQASGAITYRRETLRVLQNLAFNNANEVRKSTNFRSVLSAVLMNLKHEDDELRRLAIGTIWNLSKDEQAKVILCESVLHILTQTLLDKDEETRRSTLYTLRSFSESEKTAMQILMFDGLIENLAHVVGTDTKRTKILGLKLLHNLSKFANSSCNKVNYNKYFEAIFEAASVGLGLGIIADILVTQTTEKENCKFLINMTKVYQIITLIFKHSPDNISEMEEVILHLTELFEIDKNVIEMDVNEIASVLNMGLECGSKSVNIDKFVLRMLHSVLERCEHTFKIANTTGAVEFLFQCAKRMDDVRWRVLSLEILEILVLSWKQQS